MRQFGHWRHFGWYLAVVAGAVLCGTEPARACRTPVYRYAMYNWDSAPFRLFYFHPGKPAAEDEKVNGLLTDLAGGNPAGANLIFEVVDASNAKELEAAPRIVVEDWKKRGDAAGSVHFVYTPRAEQLFAGRLDEKTVKSLFMSPARTRIGELLKQGNAAVLLLLTGPDDAANQRAEKTVAAVVADAAAGKIRFATLDDPSDNDPADEPAEAAKPAARKFSVAVLKVAQTDPAEAWLVRVLLTIEPDLDKYKKEPMVFAVFGRGRAMPPLVGKGITGEELTGCLEFLGGPCSCQVKDQCPGADLPMQWDWSATAEALAADDDDFRPRGSGFAAMDEEPPRESRSPQTAAAQARTLAPAAAQAEDQKTAAPAAQPDVIAAGSETDEPADSFAAQQTWTIGLLVATATVVVLIAGFALMRFQRPG